MLLVFLLNMLRIVLLKYFHDEINHLHSFYFRLFVDRVHERIDDAKLEYS